MWCLWCHVAWSGNPKLIMQTKWQSQDKDRVPTGFESRNYASIKRTTLSVRNPWKLFFYYFYQDLLSVDRAVLETAAENRVHTVSEAAGRDVMAEGLFSHHAQTTRWTFIKEIYGLKRYLTIEGFQKNVNLKTIRACMYFTFYTLIKYVNLFWYYFKGRTIGRKNTFIPSLWQNLGEFICPFVWWFLCSFLEDRGERKCSHPASSDLNLDSWPICDWSRYWVKDSATQ